jgi:amino acid adenylation domain-containing protein
MAICCSTIRQWLTTAAQLPDLESRYRDRREEELTNVTNGRLEADAYLQAASDNYRRLTREWAEHSIPDRFLRQVIHQPDHMAVKTKDGVLTYQALNVFSNRIANAILRQRCAERGAVCLLLDHDAEVPAAIFGVLKSGNFYAALDSSFPYERNEFLLKDSEASLIVTNNANIALAESLVGDHNRLINIDELKTDTLDHDPDVQIGPDHIAYLVYTSGSTGQPKGVIHTHRSVLHKTLRHANSWRICPGDRIGLFFTFNFGASASNLFGALLNGASLHPFDVKRESPARLLEWLNREEITFFHTVPTFFRHLTSTMIGNERFQKLRLIRLAGETIYGNDVRLFQEHFGGNCILQVGMGSSETGTVLQSFYDLESVCPDGVIPPGYPTEDMQVLLMDDSGQPAAPGEVGEIAIRSRYMFSGYWRKSELTAQALIRDPDDGEECTYFMRDLGSRLPDGRVMHLGRKDAQVKVRGHRVEMGEVELALLKLPGIVEAAVVAKDVEGGAKKLVAYVVREDIASMPTDSPRNLLRQHLPDYMIPAAFIPLEVLPLTVSGKIDRVALSVRTLPTPERDFSEPRDFIQAQLLAVWEELLRTDDIGIHDDFFDLGGDSLLAMLLTLRIEELYGRDVNLANFPTEITIELLANTLAAGERENLQRPILEIQATGKAPPLFFLHGDYLSGGAFCRNLARHLGPDQPFYAIPPHGLDGGILPPTIEAMAADRVKALRAFQPDGPYRLGGFCWGGTVALEMARQLQAQGAPIEALLLIDSDVRNIRMRPLRKLIRHLGSWFSLSEKTELSWFTKCRRVADGWSRADGGVVGKGKYLLANLFRADRVFAILFPRDRGSNASGSGIGLLDAPICPADRQSRWWTYHEIHQNYVPEPYAGTVVLFRSSRLQNRYPDNPRATWRHVVADIETCSISGDHFTCVTKYVEDVAEKMSAYLSSYSRRDHRR